MCPIHIELVKKKEKFAKNNNNKNNCSIMVVRQFPLTRKKLFLLEKDELALK